MQYDNGKDNSARLAALVIAFRLAIIDQLKAQANGSALIPSVAALRAAAFKAMEEVVEAEVDDIPPRLLLNVWQAVMLCNDSAFWQGLERDIKAKKVEGLEIVRGTKAVAGSYY